MPVMAGQRTRILLLALLICAALPMAADARPRGARIRLGVAADARAFETHFLAMLNGRAPQDRVEIPGA